MPAGAIAFGLIVVTNAAKLTVAVARIALPPIPAPGETVANDELLDPVDDAGRVERSPPTWQAIIASVPDSAARLTERSRLAKRLLIGFLSGGRAGPCGGSIAVVVQGHFFLHSLIVAGLVAVVCGFRSRLYAERWCAWALMAAAVVIPTGVMVRLCLWYPERAWLVLAWYTALALVAVILVGATDGVRRVSPVTKTDPRIARRRGDRRGDPDAVVDRRRVRHPAEPPVLRWARDDRGPLSIDTEAVRAGGNGMLTAAEDLHRAAAARARRLGSRCRWRSSGEVPSIRGADRVGDAGCQRRTRRRRPPTSFRGRPL